MMTTELLDKFVSDIDEFKLAVQEERADLVKSSKLAEAAKRLILIPAKIPEQATDPESEESNNDDPPQTTTLDHSQAPGGTELTNADPAEQDSEAAASQAPKGTQEDQQEIPTDQAVVADAQNQTVVESAIEMLGLSNRITDLLKREDNGPSFLTVESLRAFVASGKSLADEKNGIGPAMEAEILSKLT